MMSYSAQSLGFKPDQFVKLDRRQFERQEEIFESALNSSPLSFGRSDVEFGDITRKPVSTDDLTGTFEKVSSSLNESEEALVGLVPTCLYNT